MNPCKKCGRIPGDLDLTCRKCGEILPELENIKHAPNHSGFAVVGRHVRLGYTAVTNPALSSGFRFEELWIFGTPRTDYEIALSRTVAATCCFIPEGMVHRIPNDT